MRQQMRVTHFYIVSMREDKVLVDLFDAQLNNSPTVNFHEQNHWLVRSVNFSNWATVCYTFFFCFIDQYSKKWGNAMNHEDASSYCSLCAIKGIFIENFSCKALETDLS